MVVGLVGFADSMVGLIELVDSVVDGMLGFADSVVGGLIGLADSVAVGLFEMVVPVVGLVGYV